MASIKLASAPGLFPRCSSGTCTLVPYSGPLQWCPVRCTSNGTNTPLTCQAQRATGWVLLGNSGLEHVSLFLIERCFLPSSFKINTERLPLLFSLLIRLLASADLQAYRLSEIDGFALTTWRCCHLDGKFLIVNLDGEFGWWIWMVNLDSKCGSKCSSEAQLGDVIPPSLQLTHCDATHSLSSESCNSRYIYETILKCFLSSMQLAISESESHPSLAWWNRVR